MRTRAPIPDSILNSEKFAKALGILFLVLLLSLFFSLTFGQRRRTVTIPGRRASGAQTISVRAGGDVQGAINQAQPGDTIMLEAGASYVGTITLPNKGESTEWITIRTSTPDSMLPTDQRRISPADSPLLPKLLSPGGGAPALQTAPGAHHYRLLGIEIRTVNASSLAYDLVMLGDATSRQNMLEKVPHHLVLDRCLITAFATQTLKRGVALHSRETRIENCYIAGFKSSEQDAQAIAGWNGPGPFQIINNYLEASGENLLFGGARPEIAGLVPSDIEIRRNHLFKPLTWKPGEAGYDGGQWSVKNLFELKSARRVIFEGNVLENCWGDRGYSAINLTVRGDSGAQATLEEIVIRNNVVRHTANGLNIMGKDDTEASQQGHGVRVENNLFWDMDGARWKGDGNFIRISEMPQVVVDHNTVVQSGDIVWVYGKPLAGFVFTNNIIRHNSYGIIGQDHASGSDTLKAFFPGALIRRNLIVGADFSAYPPDNFYPTKLAKVGLVNPEAANYALGPDSSYKKKATDGTDIGCNLDALNAAMGGLAGR
jgi:hypothetical protein